MTKHRKFTKLDEAYLMRDLPGYIRWARHRAQTARGINTNLLKEARARPPSARVAAYIEQAELRGEQILTMLDYCDRLEKGTALPPWQEGE